MTYNRKDKKINPKELESIAEETLFVLEKNQVFEEIVQIEEEIYNNTIMYDKEFYARCQDRLVKAYSVILEQYGTLNCLMENYIAVRKTEMLEDRKCISVNGKMVQLSREPGDALLTDFAKSEITVLIANTVKLNNILTRVTYWIQVCRSHIGSGGVNKGDK